MSQFASKLVVTLPSILFKKVGILFPAKKYSIIQNFYHGKEQFKIAIAAPREKVWKILWGIQPILRGLPYSQRDQG